MADEVIAIKSLNETKSVILSGFASVLVLMEAIQIDEVDIAFKKETKWHKIQK